MKYLDYEGLDFLIKTIKKNFVQVEEGKGLSEKNFTEELLNKLNSVESGAQKNEVVSVNEKRGEVTLSSQDIAHISTSTGIGEETLSQAIDALVEKDKELAEALLSKANVKDVYSKTEIDKKLGDIDSGVISVNGETGVVELTGEDIGLSKTNPGSITETLQSLDNSNTEQEERLGELENRTDYISSEVESLESEKAGIQYVEANLNKKVDKIIGKGLSTHDFTGELKDKLETIEYGAQKNIIDSISRNNLNLSVEDGNVDIQVPTKTSDLVNDLDFTSETAVLELIHEQGRIKKKIVDTLPPVKEAEEYTLYLIRNKENNGYEEWMVVEDSWEILGDTAAVNLDGYLQEDDVQSISKEEIIQLLN